MFEPNSLLNFRLYFFTEATVRFARVGAPAAFNVRQLSITTNQPPSGCRRSLFAGRLSKKKTDNFGKRAQTTPASFAQPRTTLSQKTKYLYALQHNVQSTKLNVRMKKHLALLLLFTYIYVSAQSGQVVVKTINAKTLLNSAGENPQREISIYLPPGYEKSKQRYPVIYYLHGFQANHTITPPMKSVLDSAIATHKIRPFILVQANHFTLFEGSFYTNSALTGNWADFEAKELVSFTDKNFRTLPNRNSRAIAGHSMGGHGALKIAMLFPEVFSSVYAMSPGILALVKEFGPNSDSYKQLQQIKTQEQLNKSYAPKVLVAVGRAFSPNPKNQPFYCDMPFTYEGDQLIVHDDILLKWNENLPVEMIDKYADNLRKLKAIKIDWGRNDAPRFPLQCGMFSQKLENLGIKHYAEEYIGDHGNMIWAGDGRVFSELLPFFNDNLSFE